MMISTTRSSMSVKPLSSRELMRCLRECMQFSFIWTGTQTRPLSAARSAARPPHLSDSPTQPSPAAGDAPRVWPGRAPPVGWAGPPPSVGCSRAPLEGGATPPADSSVRMTPQPFSIDTLLERAAAEDASDLHVTSGSAPLLRMRGKLTPLEEFEPFSPEETRDLLYRVLSTEQQKRL